MNDHWNQQLELYLDGRLSGDALAEFQRQLTIDAQLRDAWELHEKISDSLQRTFIPPIPHLNGLLTNVEQADQSPSTTPHVKSPPATSEASHSSSPARLRHFLDFSGHWTRRFAAAASLAICIVGMWFIVRQLMPSPSGATPLTFHQYYQHKVADHFQPYWVCESAEQFAGSFRDRFGQPLMLRAMPDNMRATGLAYSHTISGQTTAVLFRHDEQDLMVLVDAASADRPMKPPAGNLHVHRKQVDSLVLYELSHAEKPLALELFFNPDREHPADVNTTWK